MDCVFSQCCEQVPSGAQLKKSGLCLSPAGERNRSVFMLLGRRADCWVLGSSCELPISHSWEGAVTAVPLTRSVMATPALSLGVPVRHQVHHSMVEMCCHPGKNTLSSSTAASLLIGMGWARNVVCPRQLCFLLLEL